MKQICDCKVMLQKIYVLGSKKAINLSSNTLHESKQNDYILFEIEILGQKIESTRSTKFE